MQFIDGGVTAPQGFTASGTLCGIKEGRTQNDTALIFSEKPCVAAGVFTRNRVQAECVKLTRRNIENGVMQAVIANSGNANACTGEQGAQNARRMAESAASALGINADDVAVASTGVIGVQLPVEKIESHMQELKDSLSKEGHKDARCAIMTTDTHYKECAVEFTLSGKKVRIGAMCKGSGMIHINMGTMLAFITTDCAISREMLKEALNESVTHTFNCVSVDGDTSTNDTLTLYANGLAGNDEIVSKDVDYAVFLAALNTVNTELAMKIAGDGEGATRLIECNVRNARDDETARKIAKSVVSSNLVKAAIYGEDANFGRFLCAMGYSGAEFDPDKVSISYRSYSCARRHGATDILGQNQGAEKTMKVFENGVPVPFDEAWAHSVLKEAEVSIDIVCGDGIGMGHAWGCDLTYDYVKINGDYRT